VTSVIAYEGDATWRQYVGGYEDWVRQRQRSAPREEATGKKPLGDSTTAKKMETSAPPAAKPSAAKALKLNSKEKQELAGIPDRITELEKEQSEISALLADPETYKTDGSRVAQLQARFQEIESLNETLLLRWEELLARE
ncbi:MAG: ABC transporter ATP-binding protein, partial [Burkholderiaceae bacterium]|nr:ABC transporter ATP-binding protein [Burkholderiaceae bacterium]